MISRPITRRRRALMIKQGAYSTGREVYLVDGGRTPFIKARGVPGPFSATDLAVAAGQQLLLRQPFCATAIDEVILGCIVPAANELNIARVAALRLGCGKQIPAWTVQRNCGSGMQAVDSAAQAIAAGRSDLVLAGGTEAMSRAPILLPSAAVELLGGWRQAGTLSKKLKLLSRVRPLHFKLVIGLLEGLTDPIVNLSMGQTAEILAERFEISRDQMDAFALTSHQRVAAAQDEDRFDEVTPLYATDGRVYTHDDGVRRDTDMTSLAKLKPVFERPFGLVTAGNSAQVTDGAAWLLLASAAAVKRYGLTVKARLVDAHWAGLDPGQMGLGPVHAMAPLLARQNLQTEDIDFWEINEAFAAQVLACQAAWQDGDYLREEFGIARPVAPIPAERLNIDGGAVAIGHPVGTSGARIVLHLLDILERHQARRAMAAICIGGGLGGAVLLERVEEVTDAH
jgi:acetyl-CoA C-acetyltransferase